MGEDMTRCIRKIGIGVLFGGAILALSVGPAWAVDKIFIGVLDDGTPVEGRTVTLLTKGGDEIGKATTDAEGKARFAVAPGEYEAVLRSGFLGLMRHCVRVMVPAKDSDDDATFGPCDPGSSPASTAPEGSVSGDAEAVIVNLDIGQRDNSGGGSGSGRGSATTGTPTGSGTPGTGTPDTGTPPGSPPGTGTPTGTPSGNSFYDDEETGGGGAD